MVSGSLLRFDRLERTDPTMRCVFPLLFSLLCACSSAHSVADAPLAAPVPAIPPPQKPVIVSIVGTSDLHGHIEYAPIFGGFVGNLRARRAADGGVLLLDAGDMFQGTIVANETEGAAVVRAYNALGYDAATIGNHEFDYGPVGPANISKSPNENPRGALLAAIQLASFPVLAANIVDTQNGGLIHWPGVVPSIIVTVAGIRIGIVGVLAYGALDATIATSVSDLKTRPLVEAITSEAELLRSRGAAFVVVAAHAGGDCKSFANPDDTSSCDMQSEIFEVAKNLDPSVVPVIVAAHTHRAIAHRVGGVAIVQSYAYGAAFGRVDVSVDPSTGDAVVDRIFPPQPLCSGWKGSSVPVAKCEPGSYEGVAVNPSASVRAAIAKDMENADAKREELLGVTLSKALASHGVPTSPAGDNVAAWMLETRPKAQIAVVNSGGVRTDLPEGPLTYGAVYEMFPFDNRYASTRVKVSHVRKLLHDGLLGVDNYSVAGVKVNAYCKGTELQVDIIRGGRPLRDSEDVVLLMSDYLAMTRRVEAAGILADSFEFEQDPPIREALVELLRHKGASLKPVAESPVSVQGGWPASCSGTADPRYRRRR